MGSVHPIKSSDTELAEFFEFMFDGQEGYVYSATKHPVSSDFEQYFFKWPNEKEVLVEHVRRLSSTHEVYYGPSLYKAPSATKESFRGTYFIWAEFDGRLPSSLEGVPEPSIKIQSSTNGHEHWYWRLEGFIQDIGVVENLSERVTYHLQADLSGWDATQLLRPPGTVHHESSRQTSLLRWDPRPVGIKEFVALPDLPARLIHAEDFGHIPLWIDVIAKYPWKTEDFEFFKVKEIKSLDGKKLDRSDALAKLGHICMEMGMSNVETLSLLFHADDKWGKYTKRRDRQKRLTGIINYCRTKHPINPIENEVKSPLIVFTYEEFIQSKHEIEWVVKDFIHRKGLIVTFGPAGVGKSQLLLRFGESLALGKPFLQWQVEKPLKLLFVSMEMPHEELLYFLKTMKMGENLNNNLLLMPLGMSIKINSKIAKDHLNRVIEEFQPDGIVMDSFGKAVGEDLSSEKLIFDVLDYVDSKLRNEYGCFVWFIHHPRKGQPTNKRPDKLDDMFGSTYLGNGSTNVFTMWRNGPLIDIKCLKLRMAAEWEPFKIKRTPNLDFQLVQGTKKTTEGQIFKNLEI